MNEGLMLHAGAEQIGRQELLALPVPDSTDTHKIIPHSLFVQRVLESLAYRHIDVVDDRYGISKDGMNLFGMMKLSIERDDVRLALGLRNSHSKTFSLGLVAGAVVFVCDNLCFQGDFMALSRKHTKNLVVEDAVGLGLERVQRQFQPMLDQLFAWRNHQLPDQAAKAIIFDAFIKGELDIKAKHLATAVAEYYFEPRHPEFQPRTLWSLSNAFTEAFKELDATKFFQATAALTPFIERYQ